MSNEIKVPIAHKHRYSINVGQQLKSDIIGFFSNHYSSDNAILIIDSKVSHLHGERILALCQEYFREVLTLTMAEGESSKSMKVWQGLVDEVLTAGVERGTPVIAVGGGVTGDLGGFVAATVLRGLPLVHLPTTLLAMVDSSIGGKTGINHHTGKNLIGSFYQPDAVFADISFLETLEEKEWVTGMAEILKYGAISRPGLFDELELLIDGKWNPNKQWQEIIKESAAIKTKFVQQDTLEQGTRAFLNFGHTFGHAIEKVAGYGQVSHGEAVFAGMLAATYFSRELGHSVSESRYKPFLDLYRQQVSSLPSDIDLLINTMRSDKKVKNNTLRLVLLNGWGEPYIYRCENPSALKNAWKFTIEQFNK